MKDLNNCKHLANENTYLPDSQKQHCVSNSFSHTCTCFLPCLSIDCLQVDNNGSVRQFGYNVVFEPDATQEDLFEHTGVIKLIDMALNG